MIDGRPPPVSCLRISPHLVARASAAPPGSRRAAEQTGGNSHDR
jgi:hypothetical protein